jgi:glutaredoxin
MTMVILYGKAGCHLCDDARKVLHQVRLDREFELLEVDVSLDPVLMRRYGERIPVLEVEGEELAEYFVDEAALRDRLDRVPRQ